MAAALVAGDFTEFFHAVHGVEPFPWQARLLANVAESGLWPALLDLPTGTGKTGAIDVALFHLALDAGCGEDRRAPVRIVLVVDRRTIVNQAYERALKIRNRIAEGNGVLARVRERLQSLTGHLVNPNLVLQVAMMRGGITRDDAWARAPNQPLIAVSTVDQAGSRLLFRGYGVSESMRPVHAGLLGNDTLWLLDEVHLSRPFCETLDALESRYRSWAELRLPSRSGFVQMSATPGSDAAEGFRLDAADRAHIVLRQRLRANRPVRLPDPIVVSGGEDRRRQTFVGAIVDEVCPLAEPGRAVAVVVNRVRTAREVFSAVRTRLGGAVDVRLVTGRMRPLDRDRLEKELRPRVEAGRAEASDARPIVLVSTQCLEAGADFDFDAMVTECASLDALRQRFGRLNRLGTRDAQGVLIVRSDSVAEDTEDPIYGRALSATWGYLRACGDRVDFGNDALEVPQSAKLTELLSHSNTAPTLLPAHLDGWVQTSPTPEPDNEVALWLHGASRGEPDVQIVWREDLSSEELERAGDRNVLEDLVDRLNVCPPSVAEALSVPLHEAVRWLAGAPPAETGDVEGERREDPTDGKPAVESRWALAWRGENTGRVGPAHDSRGTGAGIRPGDTLIVPSAYGGVPTAHGNWDPVDREPVVDLAEEACLRTRGRAVLRLDPARFPIPEDVPTPTSLGEDRPEPELRLHVADFLDRLLGEKGHISDSRAHLAGLIGHELRGRRPAKIVRVARWYGDGMRTHQFAVVGRRIYKQDPDAVADGTTEEEAGAFTGKEVTLARHLKGTSDRAREYAFRCGLPPEIVEDVALAAAWHDVGKADPRFQRLLHAGSAFAVGVASEPLAKSSVPAADRRTRRRAWERSGLPDGFRHELVSVAVMQAGGRVLREQAHDWDLVLHLVGSHHGHCRPLSPAIDDLEPTEVTVAGPVEAIRTSSDHGLARLDSGVSQRFWCLVRRYGWHGLAWLEAIVRLADHRQSESEQDDEQAEAAS